MSVNIFRLGLTGDLKGAVKILHLNVIHEFRIIDKYLMTARR